MTLNEAAQICRESGKIYRLTWPARILYVLPLVLGYFAVLSLLGGVGVFSGGGISDVVPLVAGLTGIAISFIVLSQRYVVTEDGIISRNIFRTHRVKWDQIWRLDLAWGGKLALVHPTRRDHWSRPLLIFSGDFTPLARLCHVTTLQDFCQTVIDRAELDERQARPFFSLTFQRSAIPEGCARAAAG